MGVFQKRTDKHENILLLLAILIGLWGAITMVLGGVAIKQAPPLDDGFSDNGVSDGNNGTQSFIGTYTANTTIEDIETLITLKITTDENCEMIYTVDDENDVSMTMNFTYTYSTATQVKLTYGEQYNDCNALVLKNNYGTCCLWITNEQEGNYRFAFPSQNGYLIFE